MKNRKEDEDGLMREGNMRSFGKRFVSSVTLLCLLAGCGGGNGSATAAGQIQRYVTSLHLQQVQRTRLTELSDGSTAELFLVEYGPGDDCPSGCIYNRFFGIRNGSKIGRLVYAENSQAGNYDFDATDTRLYTDRAFDAVEAIYPNEAYVWYLNAVAADPDVPTEALLRVAHRIQYTTTGKALLSNPTAAANKDVLTVLANLPASIGSDYTVVTTKAQMLLAALNGK